MELSHDAAGVYSAESNQQLNNNNNNNNDKKPTGSTERPTRATSTGRDQRNCRCPHGRSPVLTCPLHHPSKSWTGRRSRTVARPAKDTRTNPNNTRGSISVLVRNSFSSAKP